MKVGVVVSDRLPSQGGFFTFQSSIVGALSTVKTTHEFVILDYSECDNFIGNDGIPVIGLKSPLAKYRRYRDLRWWLELAPWALRKVHSKLAKLHPVFYVPILETPLVKAVKAHKFDVVWFITIDAKPIPCPMFVTVWDLEHRLQPWFPEVSLSGWDWLSRETHYERILPRATRVITGTQAGKEQIVHFYRLPPNNVEVIPFPAPSSSKSTCRMRLDSVRKKYGVDREYFIYPAQFWPHKNHINLLRALAITKSKSNFSPNLILTGSDKGNRAYVERAARDLGLETYVKFLGFVPQDDLDCLYEEAVALVFPTFCGPDNLPPLEAFSHGCPVIASIVSGSEEQLGDAVISFNPAKAEELADAMLRVAGDESLRVVLQQRGYERIANLTASNYVSRVCLMLDELEPVFSCWQKDYVHL